MKYCKELKEKMHESLESMAKEFSKKPTSTLNYNIYLALENIKTLDKMLEEHEGMKYHDEKKGLWS